METTEEWLTSAEAAVLLKRNIRTLANWRSLKIGPPHYKRYGRVEYTRSDVEEYLASERRLVERGGEEKEAS